MWSSFTVMNILGLKSRKREKWLWTPGTVQVPTRSVASTRLRKASYRLEFHETHPPADCPNPTSLFLLVFSFLLL